MRVIGWSASVAADRSKRDSTGQGPALPLPAPSSPAAPRLHPFIYLSRGSVAGGQPLNVNDRSPMTKCRRCTMPPGAIASRRGAPGRARGTAGLRRRFDEVRATWIYLFPVDPRTFDADGTQDFPFAFALVFFPPGCLFFAGSVFSFVHPFSSASMHQRYRSVTDDRGNSVFHRTKRRFPAGAEFPRNANW